MSVNFYRHSVVVENTILQYWHGGEATHAGHTKVPLNIDKNETTTGSAANAAAYLVVT
jgi:hypothetical protein